MIEIDHLTKRYGSHTALSDLNLTVEPGQIYGFLGPNGAGKSTTMNIMTGCLAARRGLSASTAMISLRSRPRPRLSSAICRSSRRSTRI